MLVPVAGIAGAAVAGGPEASTSAITKKKVKKIASRQITKLAPGIANEEIDKRAPGLTVGNSDKLDGLDSTELSPGSSTDTAGSPDLDLTATVQVVLSTTITTPASRLLATAAVEVDSSGGNDDNVVCRIRIDGTDGPTYITDIPDADVDRQSLAVVYGQAVGAGTHTVELVCRDIGGDSQVEQAGLNVSGHV